jgi:hypothetical protein
MEGFHVLAIIIRARLGTDLERRGAVTSKAGISWENVHRRFRAKVIIPLVALLASALLVLAVYAASDGTVDHFQKISDTEGNFTATLDDEDYVGSSIAKIGDLDGDGVTDLAVGADYDGDGGTGRGAVYVLFMNANGMVKGFQKISDTEGNFTATLDDHDRLGCSVAAIGDLDGDGVTDLAVGADVDDDGGTGRGAVYVLFMNHNGTVKGFQKISDTEGNFTATLDNNDRFGRSVAAIGDLDGDGGTDLAVGAYLDDDGSTPPDPDADRGAVYVLFMQYTPPAPPVPVGGVIVPVNKLELLAPWLGLAALVAVFATLVGIGGKKP